MTPLATLSRNWERASRVARGLNILQTTYRIRGTRGLFIAGFLLSLHIRSAETRTLTRSR